MKTCVLLTSKDTKYLSQHAETSVAKMFTIVLHKKLNRQSPSLDTLPPNNLKEVDYLFNFLSPKKVPEVILEKVNIAAFNIHPGSHEYPGVGSASLSLYDRRRKFGVSAHYMNKNIDEGGIVAQRFFRQDNNKSCDQLFTQALDECCLLLDDLLMLLQKTPKPHIIKRWTRKATSRKDFNNWMLLNHKQDQAEIDRKIKALVHPILPGPYIKLGKHIFRYESSEPSTSPNNL